MRIRRQDACARRGGIHLPRRGQAATTFGAPPLDDEAASGRAHPLQEPVGSFAPYTAWMICDGHDRLVEKREALYHTTVTECNLGVIGAAGGSFH